MKTKILQKTFLSLIAGFAALLAAITAHAQDPEFELVSTIAFSSTRDTGRLQIYLMDPDGTNVRQLTEIEDNGFAALSPDGKKIVFDSNRLRLPTEPGNTSDLFLMNTDGTEQMWLTRGSSATWSPDSKYIAYHASASGTGLPINGDPGAPTSDSDIFVANVDDLMARMAGPQNITNNGSDAIDDDADWSPDGTKIVFVSHPPSDPPNNSVHAEIYLMNPDGTGLTRLTYNDYEERAPSWSPDGSRIVFMARIGGSDFEICVMNADGSGLAQLTNNSLFNGTPAFSPDGQKIVYTQGPAPQQVWMMNADGTGQMQLTFPPSLNLLPSWGELRVHIPH